jgi:Ca2+-transporting ATPase
MFANSSIAPLHTAVKGRTRLKVPGLVHCDALKIDLETGFTRQPKIRSATASTLTGNLLINHAEDLNWQQVCSMVADFISGRTSKNPAAPNPLYPDHSGRQNGTGSNASQKGSQRSSSFVPVADIPWYQKDRIAILKLLDCDRQKGLTGYHARQRLNDWGPNNISELKGRTVLKMLIDQFSSIPLILLGIQGALMLMTGGLVEAVLVLGVVTANVTVGYMIDTQVQKRILALRRASRPRTEVIRDGKRMEVAGEDLVVGDLLVLMPGTYVGADSRIIKASHLKIDESALTGESIPVDKNSLPIRHTERSLANQTNMAFMGTLVVGGKGLAVVVATGIKTEFGKMIALTTETFPPQTPLIQQLGKLSRKLLLAGGLIAAVVTCLRTWRGFGLLESLRLALPLGASAMPAALPTAAAANMAVGIKRMKKSNVSVRQLYALETMGAVRVICFDKTGTITRGRITVLEIYAAGRRLQIKRRYFVQDGHPVDPLRTNALRELMKTCVLCNESKIEFDASGKPTLRGSPTETALLHLAMLSGIDVSKVYHNRRLERVKHRGKHRRRMVTVHREPDGRAFISVKGDPMEVAAMCRWQLRDGSRSPLTEAALSEIEIQNEHMAAVALRVLGFAYKVAAPDEKIETEQDLTWIGMIGMAEPIRMGVGNLIRDLHQAGIETVMITGDQSLTAYAVARKIRLAGAKEPKIMDSAQFEALKPELLKAVVRDVQVYSRVNPSQKLQIVMALQKRGYAVAMTGDGINDGPALRAADIGIAMGLGGTDVAREVSDIILDNDDIRAIRPAVKGGRLAYVNLKSSLHYCLASNLSEIILLTAAAAGPASSPLISAQPLGINVFSEILPALSLLMEPPPQKLTDLPASDPEAPMFDFTDARQITMEALVLAGAAMTTYGCGVLRYGPGIRPAAMAHESLTAARLMHAYSCRRNGEHSGSNPYLMMAAAASFGLQLLPHLIPGLGRLLKIAPMTPIDLAIAGINAGLAMVVNKALKNRKQSHSGNRKF